jgi:hypothetical protein
MTGLSTALLAAVLASGTPMMPVSAGNALTLPAHRHAVRIETGEGRPPTYLFAVQQGGVEGRGLSLFRSDDGARTFRHFAAVQPDAAHHDRAELVAVGRDVALVYSYESSRLSASSRHDVYFQWWRYRPDSHTWAPQPAVRVFDADGSTAYSRAELARDSHGRLWVQAFRLESDGGSTAVLSVSQDGGQSFQRQSNLDRVKRRGGGRLLATGGKLLFVYAMHDGFEPTRMRIRRDADPVGTWGPVTQAFSDGIYHGAALSAVEDGQGGMHLVYKDERERLYYRRFNGSGFGSRIPVEERADWAMQPAVTRLGDTLYVFYNRMRVSNHSYELRVRVLKNGVFSSSEALDTRATFKGYLTAFDVLPAGTSEVPCFWGDSPDADSHGAVYRKAVPAEAGGGAPDEDTGGGDGTGGGGTPQPQPEPGAVLFSDEFSRTTRSGLGSNWTLQGLWYTDGTRAISDLDGTDLALAVPSRCGDCVVQSRVQHFGEQSAGLALRASGAGRYVLLFLEDGRLQVRRYRDGRSTVLAEGTSGVRSPNAEATLAFSARGTGPVELVAEVNGGVRLSVTDSSAEALGEPGLAGLETPIAGVWFDDFQVRTLESSGGTP